MKKTKGYLRSLERKQWVSGKIIVGIDPAKEKHQAVVLDEHRMQQGKSFSFDCTYEGYNQKLWEKLDAIVGKYNTDNLVFAVETACDLWRTLVEYLFKQGYTVLLVNPLTTYHSRPLMNSDYSKTDPKDALLVATNAHNGNYREYRKYSSSISNLHSMSINYNKLMKDRQAVILRIMAFMGEVFPEYVKILNVEIETSLYLLEQYFLPDHFQKMKIKEHEMKVRKISHGNHKSDTLQKIKEQAKRSIGRSVEGEEETLRLILDGWISEFRVLAKSIKTLKKAMIGLAKEMEHFEILVSVPGISELTAARFIAECRCLAEFVHYKQIEKMAGSNLRLCDSGTYAGTRRINGIGNKRLLNLIYIMTCNAAKFNPEVRIKFIRRQLKKRSYRKNIFAASSVLMRLIMCLIKEKRTYEIRDEAIKELEKLEAKYNPEKKDRKRRKRSKKKPLKKAA